MHMILIGFAYDIEFLLANYEFDVSMSRREQFHTDDSKPSSNLLVIAAD